MTDKEDPGKTDETADPTERPAESPATPEVVAPPVREEPRGPAPNGGSKVRRTLIRKIKKYIN
jgi:hypothetical protein